MRMRGLAGSAWALTAAGCTLVGGPEDDAQIAEASAFVPEIADEVDVAAEDAELLARDHAEQVRIPQVAAHFDVIALADGRPRP